ncbi:MAG: hypothetical protein AAF378_09630 [Cyanobacteria bacterium P01_A01_bin.84]
MKSKNTAILTAYTTPTFKDEVVSLAKEKEVSVSELIVTTLNDVIETRKKDELRKVRGY